MKRYKVVSKVENCVRSGRKTLRQGCLRLFLFVLIGSAPVLAQTTTASISGIIHDSSGAVLPGANVTVTNTETGLARTLDANEQGRYTAPNLPLGDYSVTASHPGFQTVIRSGLQLTVGRQAVVDIELPVGQVAEQVTVRGEAPLVDTTSSALSSLVDDQKMRDLPLNGRGYSDLAFLQAGVLFHRESGTGSSSTGFARKATINGTRPEQTMFLMDGGDIQDMSQKTPGGVGGTQLGVDAVKEFEVRTNAFSAEFGHAAGGVINAITKSGTNELHGSLFEFLRNDKFDARNFFDVGKSPFRQNQFGGSVGGPIRKDSSFFFFNYEGLRRRLGVTTRAVVPDVAARQGILPRQAPLAVAPAVVSYLNVYPLPNGRNFGDGTAEFIHSASNPTTEDYWVTRFDQVLSTKDTVAIRYTFDNSNRNQVQTIPIYNTTDSTRSQYFNLAESRMFSPTVLNAFRFSFDRSNPFSGFLNNGDLPAPLHWVPGQPFGTLSVTGLDPYGWGQTGPARYITNLFEYADTLTVVRGNHTLKLGALVQRLQMNTTVFNRQGGTYTFQSLSDLLQNRPFRFMYGSLTGPDLPLSSDHRSLRQAMFGFFAQDEFRMTPKLTWNYGLRYEFITVPTEVYGHIANLRNISDQQLTVGDPFFKNPSLKNFAPRLGFAWDPFGDGKTSIRSGFGLFFDQIWTNAWRTPGTISGPPVFFLLEIDRPQVVFPYGVNNPAPSTGANIPAGLQVFPFQFSNPYVFQDNFTIQRQLPSSVVVSVSYVGTHGVKLGRVLEADTAYPTFLPDGSQFFPPTAVRRNLAFASIRQRAYDGSSFYNSLQTSVRKRFSSGLQFQASYTYSKNVSDSDGTLGSVDNTNSLDYALIPEDHRSSRGLSAMDIRHNFVFNYTYEFPWARNAKGVSGAAIRGWSMSGIVSASTGMPVNMLAGYNVSNNLALGSTLSDRPNLVAGRSNNPVLGGPDKYFDATAFQLPSNGFYGNLGRNTVIGPAFNNFDFSLVKATSIRESASLQFRAEFFNIFNHANFAHPSNTLFNNQRARIGSAGRITQTVTANRQIQFALRLTF